MDVNGTLRGEGSSVADPGEKAEGDCDCDCRRHISRWNLYWTPLEQFIGSLGTKLREKGCDRKAR